MTDTSSSWRGHDSESGVTQSSETPTAIAVAAAVREGLLGAPKRLPPWLLYDDRGSELFELITKLPEYYLTRTEAEVLEDRAEAIWAAVGPASSVVELGAGSATKTRILLAAASEARAPGDNSLPNYFPVDVSGKALRIAVGQLARSLPKLRVSPVAARYPGGLGFVRETAAPRLVLFLGSNIGNYDPDQALTLLREVRLQLDPGDALLMGADLRKDPGVLVPAYDDADGVTAAFNRNLLVRINRELGGRFDPGAFRHVAEWNDAASRMEIYLESSKRQSIAIRALDATVEFQAGERIHTENSYKPSADAVRALLAEAGYRRGDTWLDRRGWFGLFLGRVP